LRLCQRSLAVASLSIAALGCSDAGRKTESLSPLPPDRHEYERFRSEHPALVEPNYFPFLLHRLRIDGLAEDLLVTCRWPDARFPLKVAIEAPQIAASLTDDDRITPPSVYVTAVERALVRWEQELGAPVRFRRAGEHETPDLRIHLFGEVAPTPEDGKRVLGMTPLGDACVVTGGDPATGRIDAELRSPEVRIYVADDYGLLTPEQVETVATHELGHALGARSHSPLPDDLMYEVARDRLGARRLSSDDVNSFAALYALPSGTIYARRGPGAGPPYVAAAPAPGPVRLAEKPWEDLQHGLSLRLPEGWTTVPIDHGVAAVDGLPWDYDASLQLILVSVDGIDAYMAQYGAAHLGKGPLIGRRDLEIAGRPALRFAVDVEENASVEEVTLIEVGKGRLLLGIAEAPVEAFDRYQPWLQASLDSLTLHAAKAEASAGK
jgi:hypothetical protein